MSRTSGLRRVVHDEQKPDDHRELDVDIYTDDEGLICMEQGLGERLVMPSEHAVRVAHALMAEVVSPGETRRS